MSADALIEESISADMSASRQSSPGDENGVLYEQVPSVKYFSLSRFLLLRLSLQLILLSTGFVFAL